LTLPVDANTDHTMHNLTLHFKLLTLFAGSATILLMSACGMRDSARGGVPEVAQCRQAAKAIATSEFDTRLTLLRMRADAYGACMQERGYVIDEEELERRMLHKEQVKNSDPLGGDPIFILAAYRQELRMNPDLWRAGTR
jgi:hypothetical protein